MKANPDGWMAWRNDQVEWECLDEPIQERPVSSQGEMFHIIDPAILEYLDSCIPEIRIIGEHMSRGLDGHPFNSDDYYADSRPLTHDQKNSH